MIGFRLSQRSELNSGTDCYRIYLTVYEFDKRDAARDVTENIGRADFPYYGRIAAAIKDETGGTVYYRHTGLSGLELDFAWQSNKETPADYYACRVELRFQAGEMAILSKINRAADLKSIHWHGITPRQLIEVLTKIGATPVKYCSAVSQFIPDKEFSIDAALPIETASAA